MLKYPRWWPTNSHAQCCPNNCLLLPLYTERTQQRYIEAFYCSPSSLLKKSTTAATNKNAQSVLIIYQTHIGGVIRSIKSYTAAYNCKSRLRG
jgi:hypothetical protein